MRHEEQVERRVVRGERQRVRHGVADVGAHDGAGVQEPEVAAAVPDRRRLVGQPRGGAHRVGDAQRQRPPAQVERRELLAEPVHRGPVEGEREHRPAGDGVPPVEAQRRGERQPVGLPDVLRGAHGDVAPAVEHGEAEGAPADPHHGVGPGDHEAVAGVGDGDRLRFAAGPGLHPGLHPGLDVGREDPERG